MLFHDAVEDFVNYIKLIGYSERTICDYFKQLKYFYRFLVSNYNYPPYLADITIVDIEEYLNYRKSRGDAASSRATILYILRSFYKYMCNRDLCTRNIAAQIDTIKYTQKERTYLTEEELEDLISAIENSLIKLIVQTIYYTGMRISECINLKIKDVDLDNNIIRVIGGKGGKNRDIPVNDKLNPLLKEYKSNYRCFANSDYFFATKKTGKISSCYVNQKINESVSQLGWSKKVSAHTLRHSFASNLIKHNVSIVNVQKLLGHSSIRTTSIYTHCSMEELYETVNLL